MKRPRRNRDEAFALVALDVARRSWSSRQGYDMVRPTRTQRHRPGVSHDGDTADAAMGTDHQRIHAMEISRDLDRNNNVVSDAVDRLMSQLFRAPFALDPNTGVTEINDYIREQWVEWSTDPMRCDASERFTLHEMVRLAERAQTIDGDHFLISLSNGRLWSREAHRCRSPTTIRGRRIMHGVEVDRMRRPRRYWFTRTERGAWASLRTSDMESIERTRDGGLLNVFHVFDPKRVSASRGYPLIAPVWEIADQLPDLQFSQLIQALTAACFAILRTKDPSYDLASTVPDDVARSAESSMYDQLGPGMEIEGGAGEKVELASPNVPAPRFREHARHLMMMIGTRLKVPLIMLLMDASETNFSGWRGAIDIARTEYGCILDRLERQVYRPIYTDHFLPMLRRDQRFNQLVLAAQAGEEGFRLRRHTWTRPGWPYIQPKEDAETDHYRMAQGLASPSQVLSERGHDYETVVARSIEDRAYAIRHAIEEAARINREHEDAGVNWRELIGPGLVTKEFVGMAPSSSPPAQPRRDDDNEDNDNDDNEDEERDQ